MTFKTEEENRPPPHDAPSAVLILPQQAAGLLLRITVNMTMFAMIALP